MTPFYVQQTLLNYLAKDPDAQGRLMQTQQLLSLPDITSRSSMAGHVTASLVILNATKTHVLTIHQKALGLRLCPGGHIDEPVDPYEAALREGEEEVGLPAGGFEKVPTWDYNSCALDIDAHLIPANPKKSEGIHMHHDIAYAVALKPSTQLVDVSDAGVSDLQWIALQDWASLSVRNTRMLSVLQDPAYKVFPSMTLEGFSLT